MRRGVWLAVFSCMLLTSCTPAVRQAILPKTDHQLNFVQKGSFYFSEEEERFIQREAQALGIPIPDREEIRKFINYYLSNKRSFIPFFTINSSVGVSLSNAFFATDMPSTLTESLYFSGLLASSKTAKKAGT